MKSEDVLKIKGRTATKYRIRRDLKWLPNCFHAIAPDSTAYIFAKLMMQSNVRPSRMA